jgi:hypothetical protein
MRSLNFTWASRGRKTVVLSGTSMTGADAPAFEKTFHPQALHSHKSGRRCARRHVSSRLRAAAHRRIRARKRAAMGAVERGEPRYRQTKTCLTAVGPARCAGGSKARERRAERMRRMEPASGRPRRRGRGRDARRAGGRRRRGATPRRAFCARGESRRSDVRVGGPSCGPLLRLYRASPPARAAYPPDSRPGSAPARARRSFVPRPPA